MRINLRVYTVEVRINPRVGNKGNSDRDNHYQLCRSVSPRLGYGKTNCDGASEGD